MEARELGLHLDLRELAVCVVASNVGCADDAALAVPDRRDSDGNVDLPSVLCIPYRLEMIGRLTARNPSQDRGLLARTLRRDQHGHGLAEGLLRAIAEQPFCAGVPTGDDAIQILACNRIVGGFDDCCLS